MLGQIRRETANIEPIQRLDLALVIPVWNDAEGLGRLLGQARHMGLFAQIVVVDDGSDEPIVADGVTLLRHNTSRGGGVARNTGLEAVQSAHVMFFDADDLLTDELPLLVDDLARQSEVFDFCLFKHADSRVAAEPRWGQPDWDEQFWAQAGYSVGALRQATPVALPILAQTANYPWNKIYRTAFLRGHNIGCADTAVHQDIALHWLGFMAAQRVLTSDRICAWHQVSRAGGRLTNRRGAERLEVFRALDPVVNVTVALEWQVALARFILGLMDWITEQIDPAYLEELQAAERDWLVRRIGPWMPDIAQTDSILAQELRRRVQ